MKLLTEIYADNIGLITENTNEGKKHFIGGRFLQGGIKGNREHMNANGRIYEEHILDNATNEYIKKYVNENQGFGELSHPSRPNIDPERVCIVIKELSKSGLNYDGKAQIVERSPLGQIVIGIMEAGGKIGVSSRALGSLKEEGGIKYVQPDLLISAIDVVSNPSGKNCFTSHIMESVADLEWHVMEDGRIVQLAVDSVKKKIDEAKLIKEFAKVMISLSK